MAEQTVLGYKNASSRGASGRLLVIGPGRPASVRPHADRKGGDNVIRITAHPAADRAEAPARSRAGLRGRAGAGSVSSDGAGDVRLLYVLDQGRNRGRVGRYQAGTKPGTPGPGWPCVMRMAGAQHQAFADDAGVRLGEPTSTTPKSGWRFATTKPVSAACCAIQRSAARRQSGQGGRSLSSAPAAARSPRARRAQRAR